MLNQDIINEARGLFQETDPTNSHVSDALLLTWIDACTLQLFTILNTLPKASVGGVVAGETITLPAQLIKLDYASIADTNGRHIPLKTTDFNNFIRLNPGWEDQPVGVPSTLVRLDDLVWMMFPKPDATFTGKAITLYGTVNPVTPATPSSSPQISITMHCVYPHYLAWKAFLVINDPQRAALEFNTYDGLRKQNTQAATSTTGSQQRFVMNG